MLDLQIDSVVKLLQGFSTIARVVTRRLKEERDEGNFQETL